MPIITGQILDSSGQPANGVVRISASRAFTTPQGHVTTAWSIARVIDGEATQNGSPWFVPATPEGVWLNLEQDLDGETLVRYGVVVPEATQISYSALLYNRGGQNGTWDTFWWDLTAAGTNPALDFPPEALSGDMGIDTRNGDVWRNE